MARPWAPTHIDAVIAGLSDIHAVWYGREQALRADWPGETFSRERACDLEPLWQALATHAAPYFQSWAGPSIARTHRQLVDSIDEWWGRWSSSRGAHPQRFSPRNPRSARMPAGSIFAPTIGNWPRSARRSVTWLSSSASSSLRMWFADGGSLVERHRNQLETAAGQPIPRDPWREGFRSALADLLIDKLAFYALVNRVRSQPFLPRVLKTWQQL